MSRMIKLLVLIAIFVLALGACSAGDDAAEETETLRVAVIMPSSITDLAFSQSMYDALLKIQAEMGAENFEFVYSENMFQVDNAAAAIRDYAAQGYDMVIAHGSQYGTSVQEIAPDFPNTVFAHGTTNRTFVDEGISNVYAYEAASNEGGYVNGVMAALLTKSKIVGIVGPIDVGDAKLYIEGFEKGVRDTDPSVQILKVFTGSFGDVALAREAADAHIAAGADVLIGTGQMVVGAIAAVNEQGGRVLWIGTQSSQTKIASNVVVANQIYDWSVTLKQIMDRVDEGQLGGEALIITLANQGLFMEYNEDFALPDDVKAAADATVQGIINGSINALPPSQ
jgi:basic membrane lipoprotein Med (substrate-binding protein (PBP1-ABC) superfamily)